MNCVELLEGLICHLPALACESESPEVFWETIDRDMALVRARVRSESERLEIQVRYEDLIVFASKLGFVRVGSDHPSWVAEQAAHSATGELSSESLTNLA